MESQGKKMDFVGVLTPGLSLSQPNSGPEGTSAKLAIISTTCYTSKVNKYYKNKYVNLNLEEEDYVEIYVYLNSSCSYTSPIIKAAFERRPWIKLFEGIEYTSSVNEEGSKDDDGILYFNLPKGKERNIEEEMVQNGQGKVRKIGKTIFHLQWADYEDLNWDSILNGETLGNSYFVRKGLSRKAQFSYYMRKYLVKEKARNSILHKAIPQSIVVDLWQVYEEEGLSFGAIGMGSRFDVCMLGNMTTKQKLDWCLQEVKEYIERKISNSSNDNLISSPCWIMKPSVTNKGAEIKIVNSFASLREHIVQWPDIREWVVQDYVSRPLLYNRCKFHLRVYVLAVGSIKVYVSNGILLLSSALPYTYTEINNEIAHITNTVKQAEIFNFDEESCVHLFEDLLPQLIMNYNNNVQKAKTTLQGIKEQIYSITAEIFHALGEESTVFAPISNCFELYGFDFLVEEDYTVKFLEANPGPDLKQTGGRLKTLIIDLFEDILHVIIDKQYIFNLDLDHSSNKAENDEHQSNLKSTAALDAKNQQYNLPFNIPNTNLTLVHQSAERDIQRQSTVKEEKER